METTPESLWELFNWLDVVLSVGLLSAFLVGLGAGFYRQVAIIFSLAAGLVLASQFTLPLAAAEFWAPVHARLGQSGSEAAAYGGIVLASLGIGLIGILLFRTTFGKTLRFVDSILGGAAGVAIGALMFGLTFLGTFHWEETWLHKPIRESYLGSHLAEGARVVSHIFPEDFRQRVEASLEEKLTPVVAGSEVSEPSSADGATAAPTGDDR